MEERYDNIKIEIYSGDSNLIKDKFIFKKQRKHKKCFNISVRKFCFQKYKEYFYFRKYKKSFF